MIFICIGLNTSILYDQYIKCIHVVSVWLVYVGNGKKRSACIYLYWKTV